MSAADVFPAGWTRTINSSGAGVTITVLASPGVAHVIDFIQAKLLANNAGSPSAAGAVITVSSSANTLNGITVASLACIAQQNSVDETTLDGLNLCTGPGETVTISMSTLNAAYTGMLVVRGHEI